jgi:hypothetical protein
MEEIHLATIDCKHVSVAGMWCFQARRESPVYPCMSHTSVRIAVSYFKAKYEIPREADDCLRLYE